MIKILKRIVNRVNTFYLNKKNYFKWIQAGRPDPPPHSIKQKVIKKYAEQHKIKIFVETGTYLGEMVEAVRNTFSKVYSIELSQDLYKNALKKFTKYRHIVLFQGDSSVVLPSILAEINERSLFWLDGHYSAGNTALGAKQTPILEELGHIFNHSIKDHIILIDDARCFTGRNDYPTIDQLRKAIETVNYIMNIEKDIIRLCPNSLPNLPRH